jgi:quinol monooxygenase YgiN
MPAIVIYAIIDVDPAQRDAMLRRAQPLIDAALAERGCLAYAWSLDLMDPGRIHVFEEWSDESALTEHFEGRPYADMRDMIGTADLKGSVAKKYRVTAIEGVYRDGAATAKFAPGSDV